MTRPSLLVVVLAFVALSWGRPADAQPLGTFRWQQLPYCNVLTLRVVQDGGLYRLDGFDDLCGASTRAAATGVAFPNVNGTVGMGLTLVMPGGAPVHLDATITMATVSGTWRSGPGETGVFAFRPGAASAGQPRPVSRPAFPAGISLGGTTITNLASPVAPTDGANKAYVDASATLVVPLIGGGAPSDFTFPAPQMQTPSRTFVTPRAGHLLVSLNVSGNLYCTGTALAHWWLVVDGVPLASSVRHIGSGEYDPGPNVPTEAFFNHIGFPPVDLVGTTPWSVAAGQHTVVAHAACSDGDGPDHTMSELVGGYVMVLDGAYAGRAAADMPAPISVDAPARAPLACVTDRRTQTTVCK